MKLVHSPLRYPCCNGSVRLTEGDQDFVEVSVSIGLLPQILRSCPSCGKKWDVTFEVAPYASNLTRTDVFRATWETASA